MSKIKLGVLCEGKAPPDKRVPFSPQQCIEIQRRFPNTEVLVQNCPHRCFSDTEYTSMGINLTNDFSLCDILLGIKEIPIEKLLPEKKYLFFSHTIKKQLHNRKLLQAILGKKIQLIDYECLKDPMGNRILGFGRYAGIVGTYNGLRAFGIKFKLFDLKQAYLSKNRSELELELKKVNFPPIKILITGGGRVASGALEILNHLKIKQISPEEFLSHSFTEVVFSQLQPQHYNSRIDGLAWNHEHFVKFPNQYKTNFLPYAKFADLYIACHFWDPKSPVFFKPEDIKSNDFKISVIADISCDVNGPIPTTIRASTIENPFYDINRTAFKEELAFSSSQNITVMAVDNLPCELPRDSSIDFGRDLLDKVLPHLLDGDKEKIIEGASITLNGRLTPLFSYLQDYVNND
jgi:alanine dehydrogenase